MPGVKGGNIYSDYINGGSSDDNLEVSACRKMFGNSSGFDDCARQRVDNKIGTGSNSCIYKNDAINSGTDTGYACIILKNSPNQCEVRNGGSIITTVRKFLRLNMTSYVILVVMVVMNVKPKKMLLDLDVIGILRQIVVVQ